MILGEFIEATRRLETYYGKEYTKEQLKIMHEELGNIELPRYRKLISVVIRKCKFLPKVADLIEASVEEPYTAKQDEEEKIDCKKCNSTGYLIYMKIINDGNRELKYQYASICSCGNSRQYKGWEISDKRYRSKYYTPMAEEIGIS